MTARRYRITVHHDGGRLRPWRGSVAYDSRPPGWLMFDEAPHYRTPDGQWWRVFRSAWARTPEKARRKAERIAAEYLAADQAGKADGERVNAENAAGYIVGKERTDG